MSRMAVRNGRSSRMLETRPLLIFKTIVDVGSFTRAGLRLGLSQPAISQHIRALEREVGTPLLVRLGKSARPTPQGEILLHYARHVLGKIEEVERVLAGAADGRTGVLRIGAGGAACQHLLPGVLREFRSRFPKVDLHVRSGYTQLTLGRVLDGDLDVGLVTLPLRAPQVRVTQVGRDELVVIVPPDHPWAARRRVPPSELAGHPLVLYERQSRATDLMMRALLEEGVFPRVTMEIDQMEAVKEMVRLGLGLAVVPEWVARRAVTTGTLRAVSLGKAGLWRARGLPCLEQQLTSHGPRAFVRLCTEHLPRALAA